MSSSGGILKLVARGKQDNYLISTDIEDSLFNYSFKKATNLSEQTLSYYPSSNSGWGSTINFEIKKEGDLLRNIFLVMKLPDLAVSNINGLSEDNRSSNYYVRYLDFIGNVILEKVTLKIGGQKIIEFTGEYNQIHTDLYDSTWAKDCMLGNTTNLTKPSRKIHGEYIYIPLKFWFTESLEAALPLIALQYHKVELEIKLRNFNDLYHILYLETNNEVGYETFPLYHHTTNTLAESNFTDLRLDCDIVFLDSEERNYYSQKQFEFIINQTQMVSKNIALSENINIPFNHPVKEIFFLLQSDTIRNDGEIFNFSGTPKYIPSSIAQETPISEHLLSELPKYHLLDKATISLNNIPIVENKDPNYFFFLQNYKYYRNKLENFIYINSFSLNPKKLDTYSGSCNFSRIDNATLSIKLSEPIKKYINETEETFIMVGPGSTNNIKIFANNYNVFIIKQGLGSLLFNN